MTQEDYITYVKDSIEKLAKTLGIPKQLIEEKEEKDDKIANKRIKEKN